MPAAAGAPRCGGREGGRERCSPSAGGRRARGAAYLHGGEGGQERGTGLFSGSRSGASPSPPPRFLSGERADGAFPRQGVGALCRARTRGCCPAPTGTDTLSFGVGAPTGRQRPPLRRGFTPAPSPDIYRYFLFKMRLLTRSAVSLQVKYF